MNKLITYFLISISIISLLSLPANSTVLSLESSSANVSIGQTFNVDLNISGLGDNTAPSLAAFFVEINYDGKLLNLESVTYANLLGSPDESDRFTTALDSNSISLDEISFLQTSELDALQPADFTLATLLFKATGIGSSDLSLVDIDLSDADGFSFIPTIEQTSITVIPVPGALVLFLTAFCSLMVSGRNKANQVKLNY